MNFFAHTSIIILAAGTSGRMGEDKAGLRHPDGTSFLQRLTEQYSACGLQQIILVKGITTILNQNHAQVIIRNNPSPDKGRAYSIQLGIQEVAAGNSCFLQNIDNPYLDFKLLEKMIASLQPPSCCIPVVKGRGGHPILIDTHIVEHFRKLEFPFDFRSELAKFRRIEIPWDEEGILLNINTKQDYRTFLKQQESFTG